MIKRNIMLFVLINVITMPSIGFASGFAIYEHGIRANGFAGAFTWLANDASAIYYNPAAISFLATGKHLTVGTTFILPAFSWRGNWGSGAGDFPTSANVDMNSKVFFPSNLYYVKKGEGKLSYGVGFFNPFGLGTDWPEDWEGRFNLIKVDIKTFFLNPTVAYSISPELSVALGLDLAYATATLSKRSQEALGSEALAEIDGSAELIGFGINYNF